MHNLSHEGPWIAKFCSQKFLQKKVRTGVWIKHNVTTVNKKVFQLWWVYDFSKNEMEKLVENMLHLPVGVTVVQVWLTGGWVNCWSTAFIVAVSSGDTPSTPSSVSAPRVPRESSAKTEILVSEPVMFIQPLDLTQQGLDIIQDCQWNFLLTF